MPVRMTPSEAATLFDQFAPGASGPRTITGEPCASPRAPRAKKKREALPENQLESQIVAFLEARRWEVKKSHVGVFVPYYTVVRMFEQILAMVAKRVLHLPPLRTFLPGGAVTRMGDRGEPDYFAWRKRLSGDGHGTETFYIETKSPGKKPSDEQLASLREKRLKGAVAEWFDDFDFGGPHSFVEFYKKQFVEG